MEQAKGGPGHERELVDGEPVGSPPPPLDDDDDVVDAEIVETPTVRPSAYGLVQAGDYSETGVPSLDYVRDKIESRHATAIGSTELAQAAAVREAAARAAAGQQAALSEDDKRQARERAAKAKLDEIRRSLHP